MMMGMVAIGGQVAPVTLAWDTSVTAAGITFSNANKTTTSSQAFFQGSIANKAIVGKKCWQVNWASPNADGIYLGISQASLDANNAPGGGSTIDGYGFNPTNTLVIGPTAYTGITNWASGASTDTWVVGFDSATLTFEVFKNGTSLGTITCAAGTYYPAVGMDHNQTLTLATPGSIPAGYTAL